MRSGSASERANLGRAAAIGAAQHGADVAINYAHSDGPAQSCVEAIEALGQGIWPYD